MVNLRRTFCAITGNEIVRTNRSSHSLHGADCNDVRIISWRIDGSIAESSKRIVTSVVTGGDNDNNTGFPGSFYSLAKGIFRIAFKNRSAQRKVNNAYIVGIFQLDCPINSRDHHTIAALSVLVQHAKIEQVGLWRRADKLASTVQASRTGSVATDDAGDVLTMTVQILPVLVRTGRSA